ncbi:MAG TPA: glycosyltransferase family 2 protein [Flavobacteriaceae bacterium]|nr:glycosyltransferase family 2 protein [Flavobacteriaceae bacterium]
MQDLTILIPVYNEQYNLPRVEKELSAYLEIALIPSQVLFINDGSTDASKAMIKEICKRNPSFSALHFTQNFGLSAALKAGFDAAKTEFIGYIDADLQTTPMDFNLLLAHREDYDLITGVRVDRKDSFVKRISSKIANSVRRAFTQDGMDDTGCPLKILRTSYAKRIPMFKGLHRFLPAMILLQNGNVLQVPVRHFPRIAGEGKFGLRNRLVGPLIDCFAYRWMKRKYISYELEKVDNE